MWFYKLLLYFCPASFRDEYSREMEAVHQRRLRQTSAIGRVWVWLDAVSDILTTGAAAHWDLLVQDTGYAVRNAFQSRAFSLAAIFVTALGIAAATTVFSVADHVLVRALPFPQPEQLVKLWEDETEKGFSQVDVSPANYRDWHSANASFSAMAAFRGLSVNMTGNGEPERLEGAAVNVAMFPILGIAPLLGRTMSADEDTPNAAGTAVLSYGFWQRRFGGDPGIIGRSILFDGQPHIVIGVMPKDFYFPRREVQMWTAMRFDNEDYVDRGNKYLSVLARLKPGVSIEQARQQMQAVGRQLSEKYPASLAKIGVSVVHMRDELPQRTRTLLDVLVAAALFVLLIAVTNLANLFLARSAARRGEIAIRLALGAGRARLIRQLLTESLLLAVCGGALGTALSIAGVPLLSRLVPSSLPIAESPTADWRLLLFALAATILTAIAFGVIPAFRSTHGTLAVRSATAHRKDAVRRALVIVQVAASVALIASTGLLLRALLQVERTNPGFQVEHTLAFRTSLPMPKYLDTAPRERFYRSVLQDLRALPGVRAASVISFRPLGDFRGGMWETVIAGQTSNVHAGARFIEPGYFATMRIPLLRGRDINEADGRSSQRVAVVSQAFIREYFPGEDGLGKSFGIGFGGLQFTIIGVASDIHYRSLERRSEPLMYFAHAQMPDNAFSWFAPKDFIVSSIGDPLLLLPAIRKIVAKADPNQPVSDVKQLGDLLGDETSSRRTQLWVIGAFAFAAFLLAAIGIHGLLSFALSQRIEEIGLRRALGAQAAHIASLVLGEAALLSLLGSLAGIVAAYALGKSMEAFLLGVSPTDPWTLAAAIVFAGLMTVAGSLLPTIRAVLIDPATALRRVA
ncbi:ABC transporter permease [Bryobacter aggregatus]|uniref:ABC transporter permease n=1 Tax=Bryobacter aggregatus TaxID=360054 RepID=UPI0004E13B7A|nr:ABC transporter permease [Bryobacter aggregatus]